ncbi:MAG: DUF4402 domain-containing protein [Balneolaceae bacterium]|nr:DUF4402 domain-containing protein [Balneolaceae bacterium]
MRKALKDLVILSFLSLGALLYPLGSLAQSDVSVSINANIISSIDLITIQSIQLSKEEAQDNIITIDPTTSINAGKMIAIGTPNSDITISFLERRELTRNQGTESLIFNYAVAGNDQDDQSSAQILDQENRDFSFNDEGRFYLWIGGSIDISTATPGNYSGDFTLEIEYI